MQTAAFGIFNKIAFSVYGEALIIAAQNFIIILLVWKYNKDTTMAEMVVITLFMASYSILIYDPIGHNLMNE